MFLLIALPSHLGCGRVEYVHARPLDAFELCLVIWHVVDTGIIVEQGAERSAWVVLTATGSWAAAARVQDETIVIIVVVIGEGAHALLFDVWRVRAGARERDVHATGCEVADRRREWVVHSTVEGEV